MNKIINTNWEKEVARLACEIMTKEFWEIDASDVVISDRVRERAEKLFAEARELETAQRRRTHRRVAVILIAAIISALTACMSIKVIREKIYKIVITYQEKYFSVKSEPETDMTADNFYITNNYHGADGDIDEPAPLSDEEFVKRVPSYVPEGFELASDDSTGNFTNLRYFNYDDLTVINYQQNTIGIISNVIDCEESEVNQIIINGNKGIYTTKVYTDNVQTILIWNDCYYDYMINSNLSINEIIKIAESIK